MDQVRPAQAGGPDDEPVPDASEQPDVATLLLAAYFVALILIVAALVLLPAIF